MLHTLTPDADVSSSDRRSPVNSKSLSVPPYQSLPRICATKRSVICQDMEPNPRTLHWIYSGFDYTGLVMCTCLRCPSSVCICIRICIVVAISFYEWVPRVLRRRSVGAIVAVRILRLPVPEVAAHRLEIRRCSEAELLLCKRRVRCEIRYVSASAQAPINQHFYSRSWAQCEAGLASGQLSRI